LFFHLKLMTEIWMFEWAVCLHIKHRQCSLYQRTCALYSTPPAIHRQAPATFLCARKLCIHSAIKKLFCFHFCTVTTALRKKLFFGKTQGSTVLKVIKYRCWSFLHILMLISVSYFTIFALKSQNSVLIKLVFATTQPRNNYLKCILNEMTKASRCCKSSFMSFKATK